MKLPLGVVLTPRGKYCVGVRGVQPSDTPPGGQQGASRQHRRVSVTDVKIIRCTEPTELYRHYDGQSEA